MPSQFKRSLGRIAASVALGLFVVLGVWYSLLDLLVLVPFLRFSPAPLAEPIGRAVVEVLPHAGTAAALVGCSWRFFVASPPDEVDGGRLLFPSDVAVIEGALSGMACWAALQTRLLPLVHEALGRWPPPGSGLEPMVLTGVSGALMSAVAFFMAQRPIGRDRVPFRPGPGLPVSSTAFSRDKENGESGPERIPPAP